MILVSVIGGWIICGAYRGIGIMGGARGAAGVNAKHSINAIAISIKTPTGIPIASARTRANG
jgi:hypothetical protein